MKYFASFYVSGIAFCRTCFTFFPHSLAPIKKRKRRGEKKEKKEICLDFHHLVMVSSLF